MTGLVLKLGPKERVLVNGVVIENGDRRSRLAILTPGANILRLRDAIRPDQVNTPVRRVAYIVQLILSGDADEDEARLQVLRGIEQLSQALTDDDSRAHLGEATEAMGEGDVYRALKKLRALLPREERLLANANATTAANVAAANLAAARVAAAQTAAQTAATTAPAPPMRVQVREARVS